MLLRERFAWLVATSLVVASCVAPGGEPGARGGPPPFDPGKADGEAAVEGLRRWYLIGDGLTSGDDRLRLSVSGAEPQPIVVWLDGEPLGSLEPGTGPRRFEADIGDLPPGAYELRLAYEGAPSAFFVHELTRSYPIYVAVSNDWDDPDNSDATFRRQEELHERHPELVLTHFVGPYTFTDPEVSEARQQYIVEWLLGLHEEQGDEIGLHIHPYCNFVEEAGVDCRTEPSFAYASGDHSGYTVKLTAYEPDELSALVRTADRLFEEHGLGKPTSFRAGGWTADLDVLEALAGAGYVVDGSGMNWHRLEEWQHHAGADLYDWGREHWATIDATSQPYYPSRDDLLSAEGARVPILEVPDNGLLVDYVSGQEMIEMFGRNWDGGTLTAPRAYCIGYHPPNFSPRFLRRMHEALDHIDEALAARDGGPAVYATMSELARVWPEPDRWPTDG